MPWVKLCDQFADHPKIVQAGSRAGWMFVASLCYAAKHLTDGVVPPEAIAKLTDERNPRQLAEKLVAVGLWETCQSGYVIHDYHDWNPSAEPARAKKEAIAAKRRVAGSNGGRKSAEKRAAAKQTPKQNSSSVEANATEAHMQAATKIQPPSPSPSPSLPESGSVSERSSSEIRGSSGSDPPASPGPSQAKFDLTAPPAKAKAPPVEKNPRLQRDVGDLISEYNRRWVAMRKPKDHRPPTMDKADRQAAVTLVQGQGLEAAIGFVHKFLADEDALLVKNGYALRFLGAQKVNAYRVGVSPGRVGRFGAQPEAPRAHPKPVDAVMAASKGGEPAAPPPAEVRELLSRARVV